jgi:molybdopterin molybdotransferase
MTNVQQLLSVAEARERILAEFEPLPAEAVGLAEAAGRVLAQAVIAAQPVPVFANSSMDGYAVRAAEVAGATPERPAALPVCGDIAAGSGLPPALPAGAAMRIMTGAPVPAGADAVVPVEDTLEWRERTALAGHPGALEPALPAQVRVAQAAPAGANIRPPGQDVRAGDEVLTAGQRLGPAAVGLLAALGQTQLMVHQRPRLAVFSTGDELRPVGEIVGPGQIRDSNSYALAAAAQQLGAEVTRLPIAADRTEIVRQRLQQAVAAGAHVIISSAGVSVGAYDVVRAAVEAEGTLGFWRVRMRPGKPLAFGHVQGVPFFGLPGNPVSALMSFEVFVRPALLRLMGRAPAGRLEVTATLQTRVESDGRETYLRVWVEQREGAYVCWPTGDQGSAVLSSLVRANGLLVLPEGARRADPGHACRVWLLDESDGAAPAGAPRQEGR